MTARDASPRWLLEQLYRAAVRAADPRSATQRAVLSLREADGSVRVLAIGKAARPMASGALDALGERGVQGPECLIVSAGDAAGAVAGAEELHGDHPTPGTASLRAADAVGRFARPAAPNAETIVLISGGTTSLIAAPVSEISFADLVSLFRRLLASGADIGTMNALRRRVLRWGAGRLAVALHPSPIHCFIASDVIGNDVASIGSGPCVPDPISAAALLDVVRARGLTTALPATVEDYIARVASGLLPETPKPGDPVFGGVATEIILQAGDAVAGARRAATGLALGELSVVASPVTGDAAEAGTLLARRFLDALRVAGNERHVFAAWGETTVRLPEGAPAGGRCQELALACARELHAAGPAAAGITVLAAGTDGRDGPTDAAGAVVDGDTWRRISAAGREPARDLAGHASYAALDAAGALLRTGPTGTNVNDLILALVVPRA